jgi:hypothetical protein
LGLAGNKLATTEAGWVFADILASATALRELDFSDNDPPGSVNSAGFCSAFSVGLCGNSTLLKLNMKRNGFSNESKMLMGNALRESSIVEITLDDWSVTKETTALDMSDRGLDPEDVVLLVSSISNIPILELDLSGNNVGGYVGWKYNEPSEKEDEEWRYEHSDGRHQEEEPEEGLGECAGFLFLLNLIQTKPTIRSLNIDNTDKKLQLSADQMEQIFVLVQRTANLVRFCGIPFREKQVDMLLCSLCFCALHALSSEASADLHIVSDFSLAAPWNQL